MDKKEKVDLKNEFIRRVVHSSEAIAFVSELPALFPDHTHLLTEFSRYKLLNNFKFLNKKFIFSLNYRTHQTMIN